MENPLLEYKYNNNCITKFKHKIKSYYIIIPSILAIIAVIFLFIYFIYLNNYFNQINHYYKPNNITFNQYYNYIYWTTIRKTDCYLIYYFKNVPNKIKGTFTYHNAYTSYIAYINDILYKETYAYRISCIADNFHLNSQYYTFRLDP